MMLLSVRTLKSTIQDATASPMLLLIDCTHQGQKGSSAFLADSESRDFEQGISFQDWHAALNLYSILQTSEREGRKSKLMSKELHTRYHIAKVPK